MLPIYRSSSKGQGHKSKFKFKVTERKMLLK